MDNERHGIRASGVYATYNGSQYFSHDIGTRVRLLSDDDPAPPEFTASTKYWAKAEAIVDKPQLQRLDRVQTRGEWRGHPFEIGVIVGDTAYVTYLGTDLDVVCRLPGMERPDRYEVIGEVPVDELTEVQESVVEVPLHTTSDNVSGDQGSQ